MASGGTGTYGLPYPLQTDPVDVAGDMQALATAIDLELLLKSPVDSPAFTGSPTANTQNNADNSTRLATTAFVKNQSYLTTTIAASTYAPLTSPTFTGIPTAPTQPLGDNSTTLATTAYVQNELANFVTLPSQSGASGKFLKSDGVDASWQTITTGDVSGLTTIIDGLSSTYSPLNLTINAQSGTYTITSIDASRQIEMNSVSANYLYVPTDATTSFPVGTVMVVVQTGLGQTTIAPVSSGTTTVNGTPGLKLRAQWSTATLTKRGANLWLVSGDLVA